MTIIPRTLAPRLRHAFEKLPVVGVLGPRQSGKSTLVQHVFPDLPYVSLERPDEREYALSDPKGFLARFPTGAILDEIQRAPDLPSYLQVLVDERGAPGQFVLTGSQNFLVMQRFSQSLAGRIALFRLLPFSMRELGSATAPESLWRVLYRGFYPRIHDQQIEPSLWLESYLETYVQRDVRTLRQVGDLRSFSRFLRLCAGRDAGLMNLSSLSNDAGIAVNTAKAWLSVLEASFVIYLLPPHHESYRKRVVKAPKLHFLDVGLLVYLLGIESPAALEIHAKRGDIFESFVVGELLKERLHLGRRWDLAFWRDKTGHELDVLVVSGDRRVPMEIKSGQTVQGDFFRNLDYWRRISGLPGRDVLIYGGDEDQHRSSCDVWSWRALRDPSLVVESSGDGSGPGG